MTKYHVNDEGNVGSCKARKKCPFGDMVQDHFTDPAAAQKHYENLNKPVIKMNASSEQLSAFRRNGDFVEKPGDEALLAKMEREEDARADKTRLRETFTVLELERMAEICTEKISYFGEDERLDSYSRGIVTRMNTLKKKASALAATERTRLAQVR